MVRTVRTLFQQSVEQNEHSVAVQAGDHPVTYGELDRSTDTRSAWLYHAGVRPGNRVALLLPDAVLAVEYMIAVVKLGAVYVPLDDTAPEPRLYDLLEIVQASHIVLEAGREMRLPQCTVPVPPQPAGFTAASAPLPKPPADAADPLYVMFTSGSTGTPKGVIISHAGVVRLASNTVALRVSPSDNLLQLSSRAFDASTFEIWGALLNGACLTVVSAGFSLAQLRRSIADSGVTTAWFTARLFDTLVDHDLEALRPLKTIVFGGEAHSLQHVDRAFRALPNTALIHAYGPTENTTFSTLHRVTAADLAHGVIPIGRPLDGSTAHVLNPETLLPVSPGEPGMLYVGGEGLALGYTDAALTRERFLVHPTLVERLYTTGDTVYQDPSGDLVFVGRADRQVKIRGYRVELDELETRLRAHPAISGACVLYQQVFHSRELFAFYQTHSANPLDPQALSRFLAQQLPAYAVPTRFSHVTELPLKSTGKVDTERLVSSLQRQRDWAEFEVESPLAEIWKRLLQTDRVTAETHFLQAGGDSLAALRLLAEVETLLNVSLPADFLAAHPTFGEFVRHALEAPPQGPLFTFAAGSSSQDVYFVPALQASPYGYLALAQACSTPASLLSFSGRDAEGRPIRYTCIEELAAAYTAIVRAVPGREVSLCGLSSGGLIALEMACQLEKRGVPVRRVILLDTPEPQFYRRTFSLLRRLATREFRALLSPARVVAKLRKLVRARESAAGTTPESGLTEHDPLRCDTDLVGVHYREMLATYRTPTLRGADVILLRASEQDLYTDWARSRDLGWKRALPAVRVLRVWGGHASMLRPPFAAPLAETLAGILRGERDPARGSDPTPRLRAAASSPTFRQSEQGVK